MLSTKLTDGEFVDCLASLIRTKGRECLLDLLCQHSEPSLTADMLQIISNGIQKRKTEHQENSRWTLDTMPSALIGEIASNLDQKDYAALSRVNRSIYIGCNDPNRLLNISWEGGPIKLCQYPQIKKLEIVFDDKNGLHHRFPRSALPICSNVKSLTLWGFRSHEEWTSILQSTIRPTDLRHLHLAVCDLPSSVIMRQVFEKFNSIQHLELRNTTWDDNMIFPSQLVSESFPNLNALTVLENQWGSHILPDAFLTHRGAELVQLDIHSDPCDGQQSGLNGLRKVTFKKLRRLRIDHHIQTKAKKHIIESALNLNSVSYQIWCRESASELLNSEISEFITELLKKKKKLTDFHVDISTRYLDCVCQAIEYGLQSTSKRKRKIMRLGIQTTSAVNTNVLVVVISRLLNRLLLCDIDEFVLFIGNG